MNSKILVFIFLVISTLKFAETLDKNDDAYIDSIDVSACPGNPNTFQVYERPCLNFDLNCALRDKQLNYLLAIHKIEKAACSKDSPRDFVTDELCIKYYPDEFMLRPKRNVQTNEEKTLNGEENEAPFEMKKIGCFLPTYYKTYIAPLKNEMIDIDSHFATLFDNSNGKTVTFGDTKIIYESLCDELKHGHFKNFKTIYEEFMKNIEFIVVPLDTITQSKSKISSTNPHLQPTGSSSSSNTPSTPSSIVSSSAHDTSIESPTNSDEISGTEVTKISA